MEATNIITEHSKFWLGDKYDPSAKLAGGGMLDLMVLAAYRRAISNFVYILTGTNIPVKFAEATTSKTDGKVIYIGGELSRGEFDPTVGLALHEAMHIVKSDFNLIKLVWSKMPRSLIDACAGKIKPDDVGKFAKYILNVVEDRYIDAWAYDSAPGYRGYYQALYNRYFLLDEITAALKSKNYREPTLKNYKFRFTNAVNPASDLDALPALRKVMELLDLENILRPDLSHPKDRLDLAFQITEEIIKSVIEYQDSKNPGNDGSGTGPGSNSSNDTDDTDDSSEAESEKQDSATEDGDKPEQKENDAPEESDDSDTDPFGGIDSSTESKEEPESNDEPTSSDSNKEGDSDKEGELDKILEDQDAFISREIKTSAFDSDTIKKLNSLEQNKVEIKLVGGEASVPVVRCIVVNDMTRELMFDGEFPYVNNHVGEKTNALSVAGINDGIRIGKMLGRKLQLRGEVKTTRFTRLSKGKIDRRLLSSIGHSAENLFYQSTVDKYKSVHLHVAVDASTSMAGEKWKKTMTAVVAMAKAASMIDNVSISISLRSGIHSGGKRILIADDTAYVVIAYDSRKDKFNKIVSLFPFLFPSGSTPEGLAFQAILENIPPSTHELDSYFVNLSDGTPMFAPAYYGDIAAIHTKRQVSRIKEAGVEVLSYFIEDPSEENDIVGEKSPETLFRDMYGKDAQFIDVQNVTQIAFTMNEKFLVKKE